MLTLEVPEVEAVLDDGKIIKDGPWTLQMEHSLISISKWEGIVEKTFLDERSTKTQDEIMLYFKCMTIGKIPPEYVYTIIANDQELLTKVQNYMESSNTSIVFNDTGRNNGRKESTPSELIYYWLVALQIPFDAEKWHIKRLMSFIRLVNNKQAPPNKRRNRADLVKQQAAINAANRAKYNSKG